MSDNLFEEGDMTLWLLATGFIFVLVFLTILPPELEKKYDVTWEKDDEKGFIKYTTNDYVTYKREVGALTWEIIYCKSRKICLRHEDTIDCEKETKLVKEYCDKK